MRKHAVIVAGGTGVRMGTSQPKQFLEIAGEPVIVHTLRAFMLAFPDIQLTVVLPQNFIEEGTNLITSKLDYPVEIVGGGETRFHSASGLESRAGFIGANTTGISFQLYPSSFSSSL